MDLNSTPDKKFKTINFATFSKEFAGRECLEGGRARYIPTLGGLGGKDGSDDDDDEETGYDQ